MCVLAFHIMMIVRYEYVLFVNNGRPQESRQDALGFHVLTLFVALITK